MTRRSVLALGTLAPLTAQQAASPIKLGIDLYSLRSQGWTPFQYLDYCAARKVRVVHFSEVRFLGNLERDNLRKVRAYAEQKGIEIEIGMKSICPTSKMFDAKQGTAEEQLARMIAAAVIVGSKIVRCVLGSWEDRAPGPINAHIDSTVRVLRRTRSRAMDADVKIAVENHAGDLQGWELRNLIEAAGKDFVGACLDSGNPCWTLEDPHATLEAVHPYVLTSHLRDSAVWRVPQGAAVSWVRMGEGNVLIDDYCRKFAAQCPGRALSVESIVEGPRIFPYRDPRFWYPYADVPAWNFERFAELAENGMPYRIPPVDQAHAAKREIEDLEASLAHVKQKMNL
ncbi:MAG: TIM barrel protein [Bryobacteraceae bacterium]|jgi:sugar phosphate isomerase/epimerase